MMHRPLKSIEDMSSVERLICALRLALDAPSDARASEVGDIVDWLAQGLTEIQIEYCKAIALAQRKASAA